jgi:hypothetical protein
MAEHIVELETAGWQVIHPVGCRGDLMKCPVTQLVRSLDGSPKIGRFFASAEKYRSEWRLVLGDEAPLEVQGSSRRIGHNWDTSPERGGVEFSR